MQNSLQTAIELGISHISVYGLKVEENTPFSYLTRQGKLDLPDEEEEELMYEMVNEMLPLNGFMRYEISNYALPGFESAHNLRYWHYKPYLGLMFRPIPFLTVAGCRIRMMCMNISSPSVAADRHRC